MKIKKGDNVIVRTGKDRGKTGTVIKTIRDEDKVVVEHLNMKKKAVKNQQGGGIIEFAAPMHVSNVMIIDPKTKKPSRVGKKKVGDKFVRIATKSGQEI